MSQPTHCKRGHEQTGDNVRLHPDGRRRCVLCAKLRDIKFRGTPERKKYQHERYLRYRERMLRKDKERRANDPQWREKKNEHGRQYYALNKEKVNARNRANYRKNRDYRLAQTQIANARNPQWRAKAAAKAKMKGVDRHYRRKYSATLHDLYIESQLLDPYKGEERKKMRALLCTPEIIAAKREHLRILRAVRKVKPKKKSPSILKRRAEQKARIAQREIEYRKRHPLFKPEDYANEARP